MATSPKGICFTGDLFRVEASQAIAEEGMATRNVRWLQLLLEWQLEEATGLPQSTVLIERLGAGANIVELYDALGLPFATDSWAECFHSDSPPESVVRYLEPFFDGQLVIGMELSPFLIAVLERLDVPYVDFTHSSIRYLPDYLFSLRSNNTEVRERLGHYGVSSAELFIGAGARKALGYRRTRTQELRPDAALFCGQMAVDSSLITREGRMTEDDDVIRALTTLSAQHGTVYYKRHPHMRKDAPLMSRLRDIRRVEVLEVNFYDLMWRPEITKVAAVSSGTIREAHFFRKSSVRFLDAPDYHWIEGLPSDPDVPGKLQYRMVRNELLHPRFWVDVLAPIVDVRSAAADYEFDWKSKTYVSDSLNMRWG